jgi:tetratricopeptide (TPR) repeat protein
MTSRLLSFIAVAWLIFSSGCGSRDRTLAPASAEAGAGLAAIWEDFQLGEFERSEKAFRAVELASSPGTAAWAEALYGQAATWNLRRDQRDAARAETLYQRLLREAPESAWAPWAALDLVRMAHLVQPPLEVDYQAVGRGYSAIWQKYRDGHEAGIEALLYWATLPRGTFPAEERAVLLRETAAVLERQPATPYRSRLHGTRSWLHEQAGDAAARVAEWKLAIATREIDPENPLADFSGNYFTLAATAENEIGDYALARAYYQKFLAEYPTDQRAFLVTERLAHMDALEARLRREIAAPRP